MVEQDPAQRALRLRPLPPDHGRSTRPGRSISNDGWEHTDSDIWGVHDYGPSGRGLRERYGTPEALDRSLREGRPGRRRVLLEEGTDRGQPVVITRVRRTVVHPRGGAGLVRLLDRGQRRGPRRQARRARRRAGGQPRPSPASATPSSPTPSRRTTACSRPTDSPRRPWRTSGPPCRGPRDRIPRARSTRRAPTPPRRRRPEGRPPPVGTRAPGVAAHARPGAVRVPSSARRRRRTSHAAGEACPADEG